MKFAMCCILCKSWDTNMHFNTPDGYYILQCLNCGSEEVVVTSQTKKPTSKKELKKMREIDERIRTRAEKKKREIN